MDADRPAEERIAELERDLAEARRAYAELREERAVLLSERDDLGRRLGRLHEPDLRLVSLLSRTGHRLAPPGSLRRRLILAARGGGRAAPAREVPRFDADAEIRAFAERVRRSSAPTVIAIFSATPLVESEGQRPTQLALAMGRRGLPVVFVYWRAPTDARRPQDRLADGILQLPVDEVIRRPEALMRSFPDVERIALFELPWPPLGATFAAARAAGWITAYDALDDWAEFERVGHATWYDEAFERRLLQECDATFAVNEALAARLESLGAAGTEVIRNGVRPGIERVGTTPPLPRGEVTVGYFGHLAGAWFDWQLVADAASARPRWQFYLIGYGGAPEGVTLPPNVALLGRRLQHELAGLAAGWDVAIVPFKAERLAVAADPIKTYEYLAMGLPVVTTGVTAPPGAESFVTKTHSLDDFLAAVETAALLPVEAVAARREYARACAWDARLEALLAGVAKRRRTELAPRADLASARQELRLAPAPIAAGELAPAARGARSWGLAIAWLLAFACSTVVGLRSEWPALRARVSVPFSATATTDRWLGSRGPGLDSASVLAALAELRPSAAVLFVGASGDPRYFQDLYTVSLLAVPREVAGLTCSPTEGTGTATTPLDAELRVGGALYAGMPPPPGSDARLLAPGVWWRRLPAPIAAKAPWTSLCRS